MSASVNSAGSSNSQALGATGFSKNTTFTSAAAFAKSGGKFGGGAPTAGVASVDMANDPQPILNNQETVNSAVGANSRNRTTQAR